jgi:hypothetical protein
MSIWVLATIVIHIFVISAVAILWVRMLRPPKEDPRLSRGLQLLQSKISVIEDLSDRTDHQVQQLMRILDERTKALQTKMLQAEDMTRKIEHAMQKSLEVAEIFQDKIPHEEIIERNQQSKYVLAAKLAHDGATVDEIQAQVDLPRSEIEFIAKVNRDELTFDPSQLPEWAKPKGEHAIDLEARMVERVFHAPKPDLSALQKVEEQFKQSVRDIEEHEKREVERVQKFDQNVQMVEKKATEILHSAKMVSQNFVQSASSVTRDVVAAASQKAKPVIKKVEFPRIFAEKNRL